MKRKVKKAFCALAAALLLFAAATTAFAADGGAKTLRFDADGNFTILHLTDWHTVYPMPAIQKQYVVEALAAAKPDLVVLGGDMSEASAADQPAAVREICDLLIAADAPFVITFGNHDYLHDLTIDEMFALYKENGGAYCLSEDEDPALFGCGTCSIPIYAHDGGKVAYCVYCFDSGCEYKLNFASADPDPAAQSVRSAGETIVSNYDSVHPDQIEWYTRRAEELKAGNGGAYVPSVVFQHIIVQEIFDKIWPAAKESDKTNLMCFDQKTYRMRAIPNLSNIKDGYLMERPCPGYYNYGQLDAMTRNADVRAVFCGHDHSNSFTVEINGIDIVNTPSVKPHFLFKKIDWGGRVITLHADGTYESRVLAGCELAQNSGSGILSSGAVNRVELVFLKAWKAFADASQRLWKPLTKIIYK